MSLDFLMSRHLRGARFCKALRRLADSLTKSCVRLGGIEPPTFCVSCKRSTTELKTHIYVSLSCKRSLPAGRQVPLSYARFCQLRAYCAKPFKSNCFAVFKSKFMPSPLSFPVLTDLPTFVAKKHNSQAEIHIIVTSKTNPTAPRTNSCLYLM